MRTAPPPAPVAGAAWVAIAGGKFALVDEADAALIGKFAWKLSNGYAACWDGERRRSMHSMLMPGASLIDHRNGDPLDNRRANLREATVTQNLANAKARKSRSGYKGVSWYAPNRRWRARIRVNGKERYVTMSESAEVAARAYDDAARLTFGPFARLNFPREGEQGCR